MNRITVILIVAATVSCFRIASGQDQGAATTQPSFTGSPAAQQAAARYETQERLATQRYDAAVEEARRQYIAVLKREQADQTRRHNSDLAQQLGDAIQQLEAESAEYKKTGKSATGASSGSRDMTVDLGGGVQMKLVHIPAGQFMVGSPANEPNRLGDEGQHRVTISKPFYIGATTVTQPQWTAVMGDNPSQFKGDDLPVEQVNWERATDFCKKLSAKTGRTYRLPTEAEWEYVAHAGTQGAYAFGNDASKLGDYAWFQSNSDQKTHPVGTKLPNAWGLYDIHGNVWQWCSTWYGDRPDGDLTDPQGPDQGSWRMIKGGAWDFAAPSCRIAFRLARYDPHHWSRNIGLRVVLEIQ